PVQGRDQPFAGRGRRPGRRRARRRDHPRGDSRFDLLGAVRLGFGRVDRSLQTDGRAEPAHAEDGTASGALVAVLFAALAGMLFGALAVAVRQGLQRNPDANAGALVIAGGAAIVSIGPAAFDAGQVHPGDLWPFALSGLLVPGVSQLLFVLSVRD